jgi:hypothetical protein
VFACALLVLLVPLHAGQASADASNTQRWQPADRAASTHRLDNNAAAAAARGALHGPPSPCRALPDVAALSEIVRTAGGDSRLLLSEVAAYLLRLMALPLQRGCTYISLTRPLGTVTLPEAFVAPDLHDAVATGTQQRMAILLMASDTATLVREMDRFALHALTHWFYAKRFEYDLLVYVHRKAIPPGSVSTFYFFLKAPAIQGALFLLDYSYVLYVDWDSYIAPLSAPPLDLLILQWPHKAFYLQAADNLNAGARQPQCAARDALQAALSA